MMLAFADRCPLRHQQPSVAPEVSTICVASFVQLRGAVLAPEDVVEGGVAPVAVALVERRWRQNDLKRLLQARWTRDAVEPERIEVPADDAEGASEGAVVPR